MNEKIKIYVEKSKDSYLLRHALIEFQFSGLLDKDYNFIYEDDNVPVNENGFTTKEIMCLDILEILDIIHNQNHSGYSFSYLKNILIKLLNDETLTEMTGNDDEWIKAEDIGDNIFQNKRCPSIFKKIKKDGTIDVKMIEGKVFIHPNGSSFTRGHDSDVPITFPCYKPKVKYFKVDKCCNVIEEIKNE